MARFAIQACFNVYGMRHFTPVPRSHGRCRSRMTACTIAYAALRRAADLPRQNIHQIGIVYRIALLVQSHRRAQAVAFGTGQLSRFRRERFARHS